MKGVIFQITLPLLFKKWKGSLLIVTPIVGLCNCSMFCCALLCVHSNFAIILMGKRELVALLVIFIIQVIFQLMTEFDVSNN